MGLKPEWRTEHTICSCDVDPRRTARLPVLCRFMQEAAYRHAEHLGLGHSFLAERKMGWVLARQRIAVDQRPEWGDTVHIRTWPSGRDKLFFYRDFEMTDSRGNHVLAASNAWSLIDTEKRERVHPGIYLSADLPESSGIFDTRLRRLKSGRCSGGSSMPVTYGDLDLNGHVNNVRYIEWMLNSLSQKFHETHALHELELNYLAEAVYGQSVSVCSAEAGPMQLDHVIRSGDTELFRAQSVWRACGQDA